MNFCVMVPGILPRQVGIRSAAAASQQLIATQCEGPSLFVLTAGRGVEATPSVSEAFASTPCVAREQVHPTTGPSQP